MPEKYDGAKAGSKLALQTAIITAVIGPLALVVVQRILKPGVIQGTKESISTITVSDDRIRDLCKGLAVVETPAGGRAVARATGFVLAHHSRYVVTSSSLFSREGEHASVIRLMGQTGEITDSGQATKIEADAPLAFVDLGKRLSDEFSLSLTNGEVKAFDKVFTIAYAQGDWPVLREGRISVIAPSLMAEIGERQGLGRSIRGYISADLPKEFGMAGSPVFDKNGQVIGVLTSGVTESNLGFIYPINRVADTLATLDEKH